MAFHPIEDIKINGRSRAFGGYIHAAKLEIGLVNKPSEVTLSFVSKTGDLQEPVLTLETPYKIQFGNIFSGNFFAVEHFSNGQTMDVTFVDGSSILDRIHVLLKLRMVPANLPQIPGIIVVGREMHPCDVNIDGKFDSSDAAELTLTADDPCEIRCPNDYTSGQSIINSCLKKEAQEILDVRYSFQDLLDVLSGSAPASIAGTRVFQVLDERGRANPVTLPSLTDIRPTHPANVIPIRTIPKNFNARYLAAYSGTLRSVLSNWCADFGWSFFWDEGGLNFIDTRSRPKINFSEFANLASRTVSKSIRGTIARGTISHYAEAGVEGSADCTTPRAHLLRCLTLSDLFGDFYNPRADALAIDQIELPVTVLNQPSNTTQAGYRITNGLALNAPGQPAPGQIPFDDAIFPLGIPIRQFEQSVVCAYYSEELRHVYNWFFLYEITGALDAKTLIGKRLDRIGGITFRKVLKTNGAGAGLESDLYKKAMFQSDGKTKGSNPLFPQRIMDDAARVAFEKAGGYLIIAERTLPTGDEDTFPQALQSQYLIEQELAKEFLGRHWVKAYRAPYYGDAVAKVTPDSQYIASDAIGLQDVPFSNFRHTSGSYVDSLCRAAAAIDRNQYGGYDRARQRSEVSRSKLVRSVLYHEKNAVWPTLDHGGKSLDTALQDIHRMMFFNIPVGMDVLRRVCSDGAPKGVEDKRQLFLIGAFENPRPVTIESSRVENEADENLIYGQTVDTIDLASYGLLSKAAIAYTLYRNDEDVGAIPVKLPTPGFEMVMPTASSVLFGDTRTLSWQSQDLDLLEENRARVQEPLMTRAPMFKVYVSLTTKNRLFIPKMESVNLTAAPHVTGKLPNAMSVEYVLHELSTSTLRYLNRLNTASCRIPDNLLKEAHETEVKDMDFSVTTPFTSKRYQVFGLTLPQAIRITDGLEGLSVSVTNKGVFTDITIGDSLFTPISRDYHSFQLETSLNPVFYNGRPKII